MSAPNQLPLFHVVGFTGHRELADMDGVAQAIRAQLVWLRKEHPAQWIAGSSIASGADTLFAETALELGLPWHALLPLPREMFKEDFDGTGWEKAEALLDRASHVGVTCDGVHDLREQAYLDCGHETVNASDVLIAVWNGLEARGIGGTAQVVAYARKLGKPLIVIDPTTFQVRREGFGPLKIVDDEVIFLRSLAARAPEIAVVPEVVAPEVGAPDSLVRLQVVADKAALEGSPKLRSLATMVLVFHGLAALVGTFALSFGWNDWATFAWGETIFIAAGMTAALVYRRSFDHLAWVRCRLVAEISRATIATWGLPRTPEFLKEIQIAGIRRLVASLRMFHQNVAQQRLEQFEAFRQYYLRHRIGDQLAYYVRQEAKALPRLRLLRATFYTATSVGVALTLANAITASLDWNGGGWIFQDFVFNFLPVILPSFAASCVSIISINDFQRRVARYREMIAILGVARTQVEAAQTWSFLVREVNKTERILLAEVLEWHTITSYSDAQ